MVKPNSKPLNLILLLSLLILVSMAESRLIFSDIGKTDKKAKATIECDSVVGVASGDTCFGLEQKFHLADDFFNLINPNINCDALFVGQWVCVDGTTS